MLTDPKEIAIAARAQQKNIRDPKRSREHFRRIFAEFLRGVPFKERVLLDLGPGHYDFGELARERGAEVHGIDKDPAVVELGRYKGLWVVEDDLKRLRADALPCTYDGVFCKFSLNAFWFDSTQKLRDHIREIGKLLKPEGWIWISPWNGGYDDRTPEDVTRTLAAQVEGFKELDCWAVDLTEDLSKFYGVHGATANRALFCRNLRRPRRLKRCCAL